MPEKTSILERVDSPHDLRQLDRTELSSLCDDIRQNIINVVEEKGGHFSSPLGVVDLTVALHRVFDTPKDLLIWDVGHQCYPHKIITGRRDSFDTLRQGDGISGFCKRDESEYDVFGAGHASTSISAALGMARARDLKGEKHRIVAVIGDGAMTGGLAYEGLNNAGVLPSQLLLVVNDNKMSISHTVGALSHYLTKVVTNPLYNRVRDKIWELTGILPGIPKKVLRRIAHTIQEGLKHFLVPGMIFEELGIRYFGPIDGHNMDEMLEAFQNLKGVSYPAVVHVLTRKGIGKEKAEADPLKYYSLSGNGDGQAKEPSIAPGYSKVFGSIACQLAEEDEDVVSVVAAMREGQSPGRELHGSCNYQIPHSSMLSYTLVAPILGIAQGALDEFEEYMVDRIAYTSGEKMRENPAVHIRLSEAEAEIHSVRLIMKNDCDELFGQIRRGEMPSIAQRARFRRNQAYVARLSTRAVDRLFEGSGGHVLFSSNPMQRCHRDAHAASHHFGIHWETQAEEYGRVRLGLELKNPGRI